MKRLFLMFSGLSLLLTLFAQTEALEVNNLSNKYAAGLITPEQYKKMAKDWKEIIAYYGGFPNLPINEQTKEIEFKKVIDLTNIDRKVIYDRIMEWSAVNFGNLTSVLHYSNLENGKIILKGYFEIIYRADFETFFMNKKEVTREVKCYHTYVFTIKDNKLKIEVKDFRYNYLYQGYLYGNTYIPSKELNLPIDFFYPITDSEPLEWKGRLDLLNKTNSRITSFIDDLTSYIKEKTNDYGF